MSNPIVCGPVTEPYCLWPGEYREKVHSLSTPHLRHKGACSPPRRHCTLPPGSPVVLHLSLFSGMDEDEDDSTNAPMPVIQGGTFEQWADGLINTWAEQDDMLAAVAARVPNLKPFEDRGVYREAKCRYLPPHPLPSPPPNTIPPHTPPHPPFIRFQLGRFPTCHLRLRYAVHARPPIVVWCTQGGEHEHDHSKEVYKLL
jgi:hypothetical protein